MSSERLSRAFAVLHGTSIVLFIGMVLLVLAQVIAQIFQATGVGRETARCTFIWVAFIGWVIANHNQIPHPVTLVTDRAGPKLKLALGLFSDLCVIVFALIFVVKAGDW